VIVFLDGHCKPERGAIARLVKDVEERAGNAIFIPRIPALDCAAWKNSKLQVGHGFGFTLEDFACDWMPRERMWLRGRFYESPSLVGCCLAVGRRLYEKVRGFDRHMLQWGVEDLDFSLRAWLMGHPILYDPEAVIGHRFRKTFDTFTVTEECVLVNKLRMARKNFTDAVWRDWLRRARAREPAKRWRKAWTLFQAGKESVERERRYLLRHRVEDEFWYARRFGLNWPKEARGHRGRSPSSR
jgi:GT2 family glycosyltransferase